MTGHATSVACGASQDGLVNAEKGTLQAGEGRFDPSQRGIVLSAAPTGQTTTGWRMSSCASTRILGRFLSTASGRAGAVAGWRR